MKSRVNKKDYQTAIVQLEKMIRELQEAIANLEKRVKELEGDNNA